MKGSDAVDGLRIMNILATCLFTMEFQFTNTADNSLKQLFEMISIAAEKK
jgi:hypothetical protein